MNPGMFETDKQRWPSFTSLLLLLIGICLGFVVVGPLVGFLIALPFYDGPMLELAEAMQDPIAHPEVKIPVYILQAAATFVGLIVTPLLLLKAFGKSFASLFTPFDLPWTALLLTPLIVISFMAVNSWFVEWNAGIDFPESLRSFEEWARMNENHRAELTAFMTTFSSTSELILGLVVIAVIPAFGEELVFRGLFQNELRQLTGNAHVSIWLAALLFSIFHIQFYGFVPRLLLGGLFGYLYLWSGSLAVAMLAHFVNNAFAVLSLYFNQRGAISVSPEEPASFPLPVILIAAAITALLLIGFWRFYANREPSGARLDDDPTWKQF